MSKPAAHELLSHIVDGVLVVDRDGQVLYANPACEALLGRPGADLIGTHFGYPVVSGESIEILVFPGGGAARMAEMRAVTIEWEDAPAFLISLRDIEERKTMEDEMQRVNALSRAILNSLHASIAVIDNSGVIVRVNDLWQRFAAENGDPDGASTGVGINYFQVCRASNDPQTLAVLDGMLKVLAGEAPSYEVVYPCHAPHEERWFMMRVRPLQGEDRGLVVSHINITQYHKSLMALRQPEGGILPLQEGDVEFLALEMLAFPTGRQQMAAGLSDETIEAICQQYIALLDRALENRAFGHDDNLNEAAEGFADMLGARGAHPRDVIRLHRRSIDRLRHQQVLASKLQAYLEEGRLLLVQVMGYLANYYRALALQTPQNGSKSKT